MPGKHQNVGKSPDQIGIFFEIKRLTRDENGFYFLARHSLYLSVTR
jgi:hypothetical protein